MQKALGRGESMVVEIGCVAAVSEACKIVAEERTGLIREPPYSQGFTVKITGEHCFKAARSFWAATVSLALRTEYGVHDERSSNCLSRMLSPVPRKLLLMPLEDVPYPSQNLFSFCNTGAGNVGALRMLLPMVMFAVFCIQSGWSFICDNTTFLFSMLICHIFRTG